MWHFSSQSLFIHIPLPRKHRPSRLAPGIDTIDASAIRQDILGHSYFGDSATVIKDLFLLLAQGLNPSARFLQPKSLGTQRYWVLPKE